MRDNRVLNAFTVDVEEHFQVAAFDDVVSRSDWDNIPSRVENNTRNMLELLDSYGVVGTFFVLGWIADKHPRLVREIDAAGHEVACHGYSHERIYRQERDEFRDETITAKSRLEDLTGRPVRGYRAASFSITSDSLWALDVIAEAGFEYDSSIFPVYHDNYGIPDAPTGPSVLKSPNGLRLAEFPLTTFRIAGLRMPVGGGGYFRLYPYWVTKAAMRRVNASGMSCNFYCHPWEIDADQPRFEKASWRSRFRHYNNLSSFEQRLKRLLTDFRFTSCETVLDSKGLLD